MREAVFAIPGALETPTGGYAYDRRVLDGVGVHGVTLRHLPLPGGFPLPSSEALTEAKNLLANAPADQALLIDGLALGALPADILAAIRAPVAALVHHPLALEAGLSPQDAAKLAVSERAALAFARGVIVTSPATARILAADFAVPENRIHVAVPGTRRVARASGSGEDRPVIVAVGSLIPRKGYDVLLDALSSLDDLNWLLVVVGADDLAPTHARAVKTRCAAAPFQGRVTFVGAVEASELDKLYAGADLFVSASAFEGYGMALTEALACGLPVVTTDFGAAADLLPDGGAIKVPVGDVAALGDALREALSDDVRRARMADASWAAAAALPNWDDTCRRIADVLNGMPR